MADSEGVSAAAEAVSQLHTQVKELLEALEQKKLSMDAMAMTEQVALNLEACYRLVSAATSLDSSLEDKERRVQELELRLEQHRQASEAAAQQLKAHGSGLQQQQQQQW